MLSVRYSLLECLRLLFKLVLDYTLGSETKR